VKCVENNIIIYYCIIVTTSVDIRYLGKGTAAGRQYIVKLREFLLLYSLAAHIACTSLFYSVRPERPFSIITDIIVFL